MGPVAVYKQFCPLFCGLGYGMVIVSSIVMLYYNLIIAWTIYYMFASVAGESTKYYLQINFKLNLKLNLNLEPSLNLQMLTENLI